MSGRKISEKELALRKELSKRTINMISRGDQVRAEAGDSPHIEKTGREISTLIHDERLEEAQELLDASLREYPNEMGLLNLQVILHVMNKEYGGYDKAKAVGAQLIELAIEKSNRYYAMVTLNNMGLIAHNEGQAENSKAMYMAAHMIDMKALGPMRNLAGWYARRELLEPAMKWIDKILEAYPDWQQRDDIKTFMKKDESLRNLKNYQPYIEKVLSKILEI